MPWTRNRDAETQLNADVDTKSDSNCNLDANFDTNFDTNAYGSCKCNWNDWANGDPDVDF
ncbi:hypothetical protein HYS82_03000 [Candidatus Amesbacteria bacterium]|nr:hypothetical protein [Candidatus Amesbacteria bacterium]